MGSESLKFFAFTTSLLESLKSNGVVPLCDAHDDADGLDGEDVVWISRCDDGGPFEGEYLSVTKAHQESDDWIVSHSDRNSCGGDPQHWSEIGTQAELMDKLVKWFVERLQVLNASKEDLGAELAELFDSVEFPCSDEELEGAKQRLAELGIEQKLKGNTR